MKNRLHYDNWSDEDWFQFIDPWKLFDLVIPTQHINHIKFDREPEEEYEIWCGEGKE